MIKSLHQAKAVQQRRVDAGRRGYARAVRRYFKGRGYREQGLPVIPRPDSRISVSLS